ncbi:MAG: polyamine aminopropyltransferase [Desulfobacterota bacterium]|nr:polyamine aminopropyltransferase [Thermodesulfobacteriota bacterium]
MNQTPQWFEARFSPEVLVRIKVDRLVHAVQSRYQIIEVYDTTAFGRMLVLDGIINVTEKDEFIYHEMLAHVPLIAHPHPCSVLVVGGGDGGTVREALKHPTVYRIELVEIDSAVVEVSRTFLPFVSCALDNPKVHITYEDAACFIKETAQRFDVILIDSTDPIGAGAILFSEGFYHDCRARLNDNGVLAAQSESPFFDPHIVKPLYEMARTVFPIVRMYTALVPSYVSGLWSFMFCSTSVDPLARISQERIAALQSLRYYSLDIHRASFAVPPFVRAQCAV